MKEQKKSLKEISWQVTEPEYRQDPALSYSTLAKYERGGGFNSLPTLFDKVSSPSLTFGSIVDTLLLGTKEEFKERFSVIELPELSDSLREIADHLFEDYKTTKFADIPDSVLSEYGVKHAYYASSKYEKYRVKMIRENCEKYFVTKQLTQDKEIISQQDYEDAKRCADILRTKQGLSQYFNPNPFGDFEVLFQLKFKGEHNGVPYRSMMDIVVVDHKNKIIYPVDLKTSSHMEWEFFKSFVEWRYDIQAMLYYRNLKQTIEKDDYFKDFKIAEYRFIVINRKTLKPLIWKFPFTASEVGWEYTKPSGFKATFRDPYVIGEELWNYLRHPSEIPADIKEISSNDIVEFLKK